MESAATQRVPKLPKIDNQRTSQLYGPSYSLSGSTDKFRLPPASKLKPGVEQCSGQLDSWPVRKLNPATSSLSLGQSSSIDPTAHHHPPNTTTTHPVGPPARIIQQGTIDIIPKPKFLAQLESYLHKELRLLGCPAYGPHELRLQAYREVFGYLIEDFKTYKPLLSAVKNEYELFISQQTDLIRQLEPMKAQLETVREECERKIMMLREEEKQGDVGVQRENKRLLGVIEKMRAEELSYQAQIEKLQCEVGRLYEQYRHEADARKLLVADYNDLKFRQQEQKAEEGGGATEEREDPVVLKLKLVRAREDLRAANHRINTMLADYGDVVPRREFEMLEASYKSLEVEVESLKTDHAALMEEHSTLQAMYRDVLSNRDTLSSDLTSLKRSATPRPDWSRCGPYLEGGAEGWSQQADGRSSDEMVDILLAQIAGIDVSEIRKNEAFQGQGVGEQVPQYLRAEGAVKNRKIPRNEVNDIISSFWQYRLATESSQQLEECLYSFLLSRNEGNEELAVEDGYNLEEASARFAHEPHVALFGQILHGEAEESVLQAWLQQQTALTEAFSKQQKEGVVAEGVVEQVLSSTLPGKPAEHIRSLVATAALQATAKPGFVDFIKLLSPDEGGQPSGFALQLLEQARLESRAFVEEIAQALGNKSEVSVAELQGVLQSLDASLDADRLTAILALAFSTTSEQLSEGVGLEVTTPIPKLLRKLLSINLNRTGPRL